MDRIRDYLLIHPEIDIFDAWPPDTRDWCECPRCREAGPIEHRHAVLVNEIARLARAIRPDLLVEFPAYYEPTTPPRSIVFANNVIVDFCPITRSYESRLDDPANATNRVYNERLRAWFDTPAFSGSLCLYTYYRKYAWRSLPMLLPHLIADELRYCASLGVDGIGSYSEPADWWTFELQHYVVARLCWDPNADLDALLDDYFAHRYGPAAEPMRELVSLLESFLPRVARIPGTRLRPDPDSPGDTYEFTGPAEALMRPYEKKVRACHTLVNFAGEKSGDEPEIQGRLQRWQILIDYVDLEVQARRLALALADNPNRGFLRSYAEVMRKMDTLTKAQRNNGLILYELWAAYPPDRL